MKGPLIECIPNFSEGQKPQVIEAILDTLRAKDGIRLLDYSSDKDHNRTVVTLVGTPEGLLTHIPLFVKKAKELIDLRQHKGQHPRMGAVDVLPFVPVRGITMEETVDLSKKMAQKLHEQLDVPIFLYESSASAKHRENLASLRKGQFEGMAEKIKKEEFKPDYGRELHESFGIMAVGARAFLVAFNVNLATDKLEIANQIAKNVRHISGGLRFVKGMGVALEDRGQVQVSMNLTDFSKTPIHRVFELIKIEASRYGVSVVGSEIVGLVPMAAMIDTAAWYLKTENFSEEQVLEAKLME
ncbi:MAG TPA: glutamate formimidoyltransferase [Clostridia bacterium]|nr:glutamate formimidoyltransferase [Clostridia bacterium]